MSYCSGGKSSSLILTSQNIRKQGRVGFPVVLLREFVAAPNVVAVNQVNVSKNLLCAFWCKKDSVVFSRLDWGPGLGCMSPPLRMSVKLREGGHLQVSRGGSCDSYLFSFGSFSVVQHAAALSTVGFALLL